MDIVMALGIFGALIFWVFIITNKPADPTVVGTKGARTGGASLPRARARDPYRPASKPEAARSGGKAAAAPKTASRGRPMPEVLAEIRKANAAAVSPFGLPAGGTAPAPAAAPADRAPRQKRRMPSPIQREFYHYFNLKAPNGLSFEEALRVINEFKDRLSKDDPRKLNEWDAYAKLYSEINNAAVRKSYGIKQVSFSAYRAAIEELKAEGEAWTGGKDRRDRVVKKIIAMVPKLKAV